MNNKFQISSSNPKLLQITSIIISVFYLSLVFSVYLYSDQKTTSHLVVIFMHFMAIIFINYQLLRLSNVFLEDSMFYIDNIFFGRKIIEGSKFERVNVMLIGSGRSKIIFTDGVSYIFLSDVLTITEYFLKNKSYGKKLTDDIKNILSQTDTTH